MPYVDRATQRAHSARSSRVRSLVLRMFAAVMPDAYARMRRAAEAVYDRGVGWDEQEGEALAEYFEGE